MKPEAREQFRGVAAHNASNQLARVGLRCPRCRHVGQFQLVGSEMEFSPQDGGLGSAAGFRQCPNASCMQIVVVVRERRDARILAVEPPELIDFDARDIPLEVVASFEEAIGCHAAGFARAAAIMVRRTLEELCAHQGATGATLAKRVEDLRSKVILPPALLEGLDDIRLFGNDAAHIEARIYDEIGPDEVAVVIEFTKEVLKAVYQTGALLDRLRSIRPAEST